MIQKAYEQFDDGIAWLSTHYDDLWIYDKLILSRKLGYNCGPHGVDTPYADFYVVRPCVNLLGMGIGTEIIYLDGRTDDAIEPGTFWCEMFHGRHLSIDYHKGKQVLCVEGIIDEEQFPAFKRWDKVDDEIPMPDILKELKGEYEWINIEMIDDKLIEVHLRSNPDFRGHNSPYIKPVWEHNKSNLDKLMEDGEEFVSLVDGNRIGYIYRKD